MSLKKNILVPSRQINLFMHVIEINCSPWLHQIRSYGHSAHSNQLKSHWLHQKPRGHVFRVVNWSLTDFSGNVDKAVLLLSSFWQKLNRNLSNLLVPRRHINLFIHIIEINWSLWLHQIWSYGHSTHSYQLKSLWIHQKPWGHVFRVVNWSLTHFGGNVDKAFLFWSSFLGWWIILRNDFLQEMVFFVV